MKIKVEVDEDDFWFSLDYNEQKTFAEDFVTCDWVDCEMHEILNGFKFSDDEISDFCIWWLSRNKEGPPKRDERLAVLLRDRWNALYKPKEKSND